MKKILLLIIGLCICLISFGEAFGQVGSLAGVVLNQGNYPIPGLTISLVHPLIGRSYPSITDNLGRFSFSNVPLRNDFYYIEIYWGNTLLYRNTIVIDRDYFSWVIKLQ